MWEGGVWKGGVTALVSSESVLHYELDLLDTDKLPYHGPCSLEVSPGELVLLTSNTQEEVVKWKLAHIRSFKAKKNTLTIFTGT